MPITLTWNDTNTTETGHKVYRSLSPMSVGSLPEPIATLGANVTSYMDSDVVEGQTYYYRVAAVRNASEAVSSEITVQAVAANPLVAPSGLVLELVAEEGGGSTLPSIIGEAFGGGFYAGNLIYADGEYIIIVAPKSSEALLAQKTENSTSVGTSSYHDGSANSSAMQGDTFPAAQHCRNYLGGGFNDWYLPSRDELEVLYRNLKPSTSTNYTGSRSESGSVGGNANSVPLGAPYTSGSPSQTTVVEFKVGGAEALVESAWYWTSSQASAQTSFAWVQRFNDGLQGTTSKTNLFNVRPIRRVAKTA